MTTSDAVISALQTEIPELLEKHSLPGLAAASVTRPQSYGRQVLGRRARRALSDHVADNVQRAVVLQDVQAATAVMLAVQRGFVDLEPPIGRLPARVHRAHRFEKTARIDDYAPPFAQPYRGFTHEPRSDPISVSARRRFTAALPEHLGYLLRFPVGHHYETPTSASIWQATSCRE